MSITERIKNNPRLKKFVHRMIIPAGGYRPRWWVRWFVNPFTHKKGKGAKVRGRVRLDVMPFNKFEMGDRAVIESFCTINNGVGDLYIGSDTLVGIGNTIIGPVRIGSNVIMAQNIVISGLNHIYEDINIPIVKQNVTTAPINIGDDSWIGANAVITAGVTIGKHCVVAGGSVVTKSIPDYSVAVGNPARVIKQYDHTQKAWVRV